VILSNHAPELPALVTALGLGPVVDATVPSALTGAEKSNPRILQYAFQLTGAGDDVRMLGHNPVADIAGAQAVGMRAAHVGDGRTLIDAAKSLARVDESRSLTPATRPVADQLSRLACPPLG